MVQLTLNGQLQGINIETGKLTMSNDVAPIDPVDLRELLQEPFKPIPWIVENLICYPGLYILAGPPKSGKSWLVIDLQAAIACGLNFFGFETHKVKVLYLALEDTIERVHRRACKILDELPGKMDIVTSAKSLNNGFLNQLEEYIQDNPDCKLIVIDTLQMIRDNKNEFSYANDYREMSRLKKFADQHQVTILAVHHARKMGDSDVFNTVSGTNGITGCADGTFVLSLISRADGTAFLTFTGRDSEMCELQIKLENCKWKLERRTSKEELEERDIPDEVLRTVEFMNDRPEGWRGTTSELYRAVEITEISVEAFGKRLAQHSLFLSSRNIEFKREHTSKGTYLRLSHESNKNSDDEIETQSLNK